MAALQRAAICWKSGERKGGPGTPILQMENHVYREGGQQQELFRWYKATGDILPRRWPCAGPLTTAQGLGSGSI